jgi:hypothetical protein
MYTYIDEFAKKAGNGAFPNLQRADIVSGLKERMATPHSVDQSVASLCGPACLAFIILKHLPAMWAAYVMGLYDNGSAMLGKLRVQPSKGCRNVKLPPPNPDPKKRTTIHPVDWVGLASLRDSENANFEYNSPSDAFPGITTPGELEKWLKALKMADVREKTNFWFLKDMDDFKRAAILYAQGYAICLFVNDEILYGHRVGKLSVPNHWCVLNGNPILGRNSLITTQIFTWGKNRQVSVTEDVFLRGFYGYVAAKWA